MSFHHTERDDGRKAGQVICVFDGAFGDAIILGFDDDGNMKVGRPYAYVSSAGTTGPVTLTGVETLIYPRGFAHYIVMDASDFRSTR